MPATDLNSIQWIHGAEDCSHSTDPPLQVVAFDEDTFILRQSKCVHFEAPFLYLFFGSDTVLLHDTGATSSPQEFPIRQTVDEIIRTWLQARGKADIRRIVTHSHGHTDHTDGDAQFADLPSGSIAGTGVPQVAEFFAIPDWPLGSSTLDLGGRILDVLPTPGHFEDHIMLFDRSRGILLSGDTLYPGLLVVRDWDAYRRSIQRLGDFARATAQNGSPVVHILGAHIEMSNQPGQLFPYGVTFQPDEHPLPLPVATLFELEAALEQAGPEPAKITFPHFVVEPIGV